MAGAYGNRPPTRRPPPRSSLPMPGWVWGLAGLTLGLGVAAFVYISRPAEPMPVVATPRLSGEAAVRPSPTPEPRSFSFYELLPKQSEVMVEPRPIEPPPKGAVPTPPPAVAATEYWVQVAAYRSEQDANRQKAALALLGHQARVERVTIDGREPFFRVRLGPVTGLPTAQKLSDDINRNGFESMVVRVQ